jgi:hypothetical protein
MERKALLSISVSRSRHRAALAARERGRKCGAAGGGRPGGQFPHYLGARLHIVPSESGRMTETLPRDMIAAADAIAADTGASGRIS